MDPIVSNDERELRAQLSRARERLERLVGDLRAIDRELDGLSAEHKQHQLLGRACDALDELSALGAAGLFWGEGGGGDRLHLARARVEGFQKRLGEVEERRQIALEAILQQQDGTELLEADVRELEREAEEREHEWIVEREISALPARPTVMPWARGGEDDARFRKNLASSLLLSIAFGLVIPRIDLPLPEPWKPSEAPERVARLIQEPRSVPREVRPREAKPEPATQSPIAKAKPVPAPQAPERSPGPGAGSGIGPASAPKGILAFREKLSGVAAREPGVQLGLQARISTVGDLASGQPLRSMITTQAPGSSGGINLASLSRGLGGGGGQALGGVQVERVASAIVGDGGGGGAAGTGAVGARSGPAAGRTDEEIQIVFDRYKAALYRLYNRELRIDPTLRGQIVLRLRIEPDGSVSLCELHLTDMNAPQLAAQVVERVRSFDFGAKEGIAAVTILYPIEFLPAT